MTTPAGWYANPEDSGTERWWDGVAWTGATRPNSPGPDAWSPPPPPNFGGGGAGYGTSPPPPGAGYSPPGHYSQPGYAMPGAGKPDSRLGASILVTLLCCLPLGVVAIIQSSKVDSLWAAGDYGGAQRASDEAKKWITYAIIGGVIALPFVILANS